MRFARPEFLWFLLAVPALAVGLALGLARRRQALIRFASEPLVDRLVQSAPLGTFVVKAVLLVAAALFFVLAAARPQWGTTLEQVSRQGVDIIVGIDVSESMLAEDYKPNRLRKSVEEASRLLDRLQGDRVGLVAFAGSGGVLCPLTLDYNAVRIFLDTMTTDMISFPGTNLAEALRAGQRAFGEGERKFKVMILFTDGEDQVSREDAERAAQAAIEEGLVVHAVGVGTPSGEPIPLRNRDGTISGYKKDEEGKPVTTRLDERLLARIAEITGGAYYPATSSENELDLIAEKIAAMDKKELQAKLTTQYEERYQFPLACGLLLLFVESFLTGRRRVRSSRPAAGRLAAAVLVPLLLASGAVSPARADSAQSLVEEGNRLYDEGRLGEALQRYLEAEKADPANPAIQYNIGNVLYKQGEFEKSYERYRQAFSASDRELAEGARFNAGNSHFAREQWQDAIHNYREALRMDPSDLDAKRNLELALLNLQRQQQQPQQQPQQQQDQDQQQPQDQQEQDQQDQGDEDQEQEQQPQQQKQQQSPAQEKDKLSREEAMRILDALKDQDKPPKDQLKVPPPDKRPEKDW